MWLPTRRFSAAFYLLMIIIVLIVALLKQSVFLVLFLLFIEIIAGNWLSYEIGYFPYVPLMKCFILKSIGCWYSLSYIPFGRKIVLQFLRGLGICYPCFYVSDALVSGNIRRNLFRSSNNAFLYKL